ncbi:hypothetical protein [Rhizobium sp. BK602]|uniref:hypothetical protein n=1 Tax=Rhizobium sp. BK602 TaxID=2586986 RepID=UPI0016089243|nr:hypothetical protein [Rhizobium sp. BK602]MBB3608787.1 hypothetical protein [Rhizobium sp. BK602]
MKTLEGFLWDESRVCGEREIEVAWSTFKRQLPAQASCKRMILGFNRADDGGGSVMVAMM